MAVNFDNQQAQQQQPQQQATQQQQQFRQQRNTPSVSFGVGNPLSSFGSGGDVYEKLYTKITEICKSLNTDKQNSDVSYGAVKLLRQGVGLNYSSIVLTHKTAAGVVAHALIVEKTGDNPDKIMETVGGQRYEILRTASDALDDKFVNEVQKKVSTHFGVEVSAVSVVDGTLVPREFDVESDSQVNSLISNAVAAVHTENYIRETGYNGINISDIVNSYSNGKFMVSMSFNNGEDILDQSGLPVR